MRFPALALLTLGLAAPAAAQTPIVRVSFAPPPARVVSRPVFAQGQPNPTKKPPQKDPIFSWKDHPMLTFGIVEIAFRARLQFDHEATDESIELEEDVNRGLDLSRRRIGIAGQVRRYAEFQVEYDLQDDDGSVAGRVRHLHAVRRGAVSAREVQAAVQPRREHQRHQPRLRVPVARRQHAGAGTRHRLDGARPRRQGHLPV